MKTNFRLFVFFLLFFSSAPVCAGIVQPMIEPVQIVPPDRVRAEVGFFTESQRNLHGSSVGPRKFTTSGINPLKVSFNAGAKNNPLEIGVILGFYRENYQDNYQNRDGLLGPMIYLKNQFSPHAAVLMGLAGKKNDSNELLGHDIPDFRLNFPFEFPLSGPRVLYGEFGYHSHSGSPTDYDGNYASVINYGLGLRKQSNNLQTFLELKGQSAPLENNFSYHDRLRINAGGKIPLQVLFGNNYKGSITPVVSHGLKKGSPDLAFRMILKFFFKNSANNPRIQRPRQEGFYVD